MIVWTLALCGRGDDTEANTGAQDDQVLDGSTTLAGMAFRRGSRRTGAWSELHSQWPGGGHYIYPGVPVYERVTGTIWFEAETGSGCLGCRTEWKIPDRVLRNKHRQVTTW